MKISKLRIQNFRVFRDETIEITDYTCLVGPNGSGKSTILYALKLFFRDKLDSQTDLLNLETEDFHNSDTSKPIKITVTFTDLNQQAQEDFKDYFRQNELVVTATAYLEEGEDKARVTQHGQRMGITAFTPFFGNVKEETPVSELKEIYGRIMEQYPDLPQPGTKQKMIDSLHDYETNHPELTELIPSPDQFYGFTKGSNRLAKHIQWIFVPAVKDASDEQIETSNTALGKLLARTVRERVSFKEQIKNIREEAQKEYQQLLDNSQGELDDLSATLKKRIIEWAHPGAGLKLEWKQDQNKSIRVEEPLAQIIASEGPFSGNIARFGHGLQRSFLLALLQVLSGESSDESPTLILACEEPELYQHPPQARHMAFVLHDLSMKNSQVLLSTHSPYFVSGRGFENVRMIRKSDDNTHAKINHLSYERLTELIAEARGEDPHTVEGMLAKIHQELQPAINEIFFTKVVVLVEGIEDIAYITTYLNLLGYEDDLRRFGCHIVPTNGKSHMIQPLAITKHMRMPTMIVFDSDGHLSDSNGSQVMHEKDNLTLLRLSNVTDPDPFPKDTFWSQNVVMWPSEMGTVIQSDFDPQELENYKTEIRARYGNVKGLQKNSIFIADLLERAWQDGKRSATLEQLCSAIRDFAKGRN